RAYWNQVIGYNLDAVLLTIETGYARPEIREVTKEYLSSVLEPIVQTILNAYVLSPFYLGIDKKMRIFREAIELSIRHMRRARLGVALPYLSENAVELGTGLLDPLSYFKLGAEVVLSLCSSQKLHYKSVRAPFQSDKKI